MIDIVDPDPPISAIVFLFSTRATWFWLLAAVVLLADLSVYVLPQSSPFNYVRYLLGSFLVLYLPGASLVELLFPKREDLSQLLRLALSIGMSLAIVPLVGLLLNYTPLGITLDAIMVSLNFLTVAFSFGAVLRKYQNHMSTFEGQASNRS